MTKNKLDLVLPNERLDDLQINNLFIIQNPNGYCFTSDAVKLANFVKTKKNAKVVELCSGSGVIAILLSAKQPVKSITCVELQKSLADMSKRSVDYNNLDSVIQVVNMPLQDIHSVIGGGYDTVVCNPPYKDGGKISDNPEIAIAKHELKVTIDEIACESGKLLKSGGKFYCVIKEDRLTDLICALRKNKIEPKTIKICKTSGASIVLVDAVKDGQSGIRLILE